MPAASACSSLRASTPSFPTCAPPARFQAKERPNGNYALPDWHISRRMPKSRDPLDNQFFAGGYLKTLRLWYRGADSRSSLRPPPNGRRGMPKSTRALKASGGWNGLLVATRQKPALITTRSSTKTGFRSTTGRLNKMKPILLTAHHKPPGNP
jgi:hypothetical protein